MSLTSIRLGRFKSFADSGDITLAPLTLIFGRNNTGKSSILQSLLLLRQTMDLPEYGPRLNLRGPLYPAGSYADLVHQHRSTDHITMQFTLSLLGQRRRVSLGLEFRSDEPQPPRLIRLSVEAEGIRPLLIRPGRGAGGPFELVIGDRRLGGERRAEFRFLVNRFLPLIGPEPTKGPTTRDFDRTRRIARQALWDFTQLLRDLRAVGPFRQAPHRRYEYLGRLPARVDVLGEHVVQALIEDASARRRRGDLIRSVNRWLRRVGRVRLMPLRRISKAVRLFELRLRDTDSGRWANFADVGFGIGQALPVLVEGLRTPPGGLFVVQEPEIHLHPDAQLAMADFLIDLAKTERFVIAETHSEHLLLRVRHRLLTRSSAPARLSPNEVSIVYVDKARDGRSHTRILALDKLAQVKDWPKGFMEEATNERLEIMERMATRVESER